MAAKTLIFLGAAVLFGVVAVRAEDSATFTVASVAYIGFFFLGVRERDRLARKFMEEDGWDTET